MDQLAGGMRATVPSESLLLPWPKPTATVSADVVSFMKTLSWYYTRLHRIHAPGKPLIRVSDQTMLAACQHVSLGGVALGVGLSWRDQWRGGGGVVGALCVVTMLELLRKGRKLSSEDGYWPG